MSDGTPAWRVELRRELLPIDLTEEGEEWAHHLSVALARLVGVYSFQTRAEFDAPDYQVEMYVTGSTLRSRLWLKSYQQGVHAVIVGDGPESEDQVTPWSHAVEAALKALGATHKSFPWHAVVGPSPRQRTQFQAALNSATMVGPLHLHPGGVRFHEAVEPEMPSFGARSLVHSWPIIVHGEARGYSWWKIGSEIAALDINRLCALLSLVSDCHWTVRHSPACSIDSIPLGVPSCESWDSAIVRSEVENHSLAPPDAILLPGWMTSAWEYMRLNEPFANAVAAFHEGLALQWRHPSYALIAFVGAIEVVGETISALRRCEACKQYTGSGQRFKQALGLVMEESKAKALYKEVYGLRSLTAHSGRLHGTEPLLGSVPRMGGFSQDPREEFTSHLMFQMRSATRKLLTMIAERSASDGGARGLSG